MISSALYFICFAVLLLDNDKGIRTMSVFGMVHIVAENILYWWFCSHTYAFDLSLYLTFCWFLDISLIFLTACALTGWRKKLMLALSLPILFCQILVMQFPFILPNALGFTINSSYPTFMEVILLCAAYKSGTIKEWLKTSVVVGFIIIARIVPGVNY